MKFLKIAAAVALMMSLGSAAKAAVIASQSFAYSAADGATMDTITSVGGFNMSGSYQAGNGTIDRPVYSTSGLTHTGSPAPSGGAVRFSANNYLRGTDWASTAAPPAQGTYWYSFLFNPNSGARGTFNIMIPSASSNGQDGVGMRVDNEANNASGTNLIFKALSPTGGTSTGLTFSSGYGATYLIVGRAIIGDGVTLNSSSNTIWVNPTIGGTAPDVLDPSQSTTFTATNTLIARLGGRMFGAGTGGSASTTMLIDEVYIGNTFSDVTATAIPEPTSLAVLGVATAAGAFYRRRKAKKQAV